MLKGGKRVPKIPPLALLPPLMFVALAGLFLGGMFRDDPNALPSTLVGRPAPVVEFDTLGAKPNIDSAALLAPEVKLVNFWASWCAPCRVEHRNLAALTAEGITIYGVNYKDSESKALGFLEELGDPYKAIGVDERGRAAVEWGVYGVPETFVIDGSGNVVLRFAGPITERILETQIRPAIEGALGAQ